MDRTNPEALAAIARTRAQGLHWWGQLLGITLVDRAGVDNAAAVRLRMPPTPSVVAHATLTDLGLGLAVRTNLGPGSRLVTASLSTQHATLSRGAITCTACLRSFDGTRALAHAELTDECGDLVATAQGWFLVLEIPAEASVPHWALGVSTFPELTEADLTEPERIVARTATAARSRADARGTPLADELVGFGWEGDDPTVATIPVGPHLGNRIGDVQGGALYGIAAAVATRAAGRAMRLADGSAQYLRPGRGERLTATARTRKRGRSAAFVEVVVDAEAGTALSAQFSFHAS